MTVEFSLPARTEAEPSDVYVAAQKTLREKGFTAAMRELDAARERLAKSYRVQAACEGWIT